MIVASSALPVSSCSRAIGKIGCIRSIRVPQSEDKYRRDQLRVWQCCSVNGRAHGAAAPRVPSLGMRRIFYTFLLAAPLLSGAPRTEKRYQVGRIETRLGEILSVLDDQPPPHKPSFTKLAGEHARDPPTSNRAI